MACEQREGLFSVEIPNAKRMVSTSRNHVSVGFVNFNVANRSPVTLELALILKHVILVINGGVNLEHLRLLILSAENSQILLMVAHLLNAEDRVRVTLGRQLHSVHVGDHLVLLNVKHVEVTINGA